MIFLAVPFSAHKSVAKHSDSGTARSSSTLRTPFMLLRKSWEVVCLPRSCPKHLSEHASSKPSIISRRSSLEQARLRKSKSFSFQAMTPMLAQMSRPWQLSLASLQSNSEVSIRAAHPFMLVRGFPAGSYSRTSLRSPDYIEIGETKSPSSAAHERHRARHRPAVREGGRACVFGRRRNALNQAEQL